MDRSEVSAMELQNNESFGRRAFVSGLTVAAVSSAMTVLFRNVLPAADNDKEAVNQLRRDTNKLWLRTQDRMLDERQKPLIVGDEGLIIREEKEMIRFEYNFHLHPLRELPGISHINRFKEFVESWIAERGIQDHWFAFPIDVQQGVEPDECCIIPQSMYWYHLKCTAMPKPLRHRGGMIA